MPSSAHALSSGVNVKLVLTKLLPSRNPPMIQILFPTTLAVWPRRAWASEPANAAMLESDTRYQRSSAVATLQSEPAQPTAHTQASLRWQAPLGALQPDGHAARTSKVGRVTGREILELGGALER